MLPEKFIKDEKGTAGLPIRIVVLSIVGLVGFYAILSAIADAPAPPEPMYAKANMSTFSINSTGNGGEGSNLTILVTVLDRESRRIGGANVIAWSPDRKNAVSGVTGPGGDVMLRLSNPQLPKGKAEGYVAVKVMKSGYRDFEDTYFVKVSRI